MFRTSRVFRISSIHLIKDIFIRNILRCANLKRVSSSILLENFFSSFRAYVYVTIYLDQGFVASGSLKKKDAWNV